MVPDVAADETIRLWSTHDGQHIRTFTGHSMGISDIAWSSDSQLLCSASDDTTVRIWQVTRVSQIPGSQHALDMHAIYFALSCLFFASLQT